MATKEKKRYLLTYSDGSIYSEHEGKIIGINKNINTNMIWSSEINELEVLFETFKGQIPDLDKELERLINTNDPIVILLYARRSLEVIVTELCEKELKRPRKTQPLKGIIDLLNCKEKVPAHIITSMHNLNSLSAYGTHPKDFDVEQVKPVLNSLYTIIKWNLKYKQIQISDRVNPSSIVYQKSTHKAGYGIRTVIALSSLILIFILGVYYFYPLLFSTTEEMIIDKTVALLPFKDISEKHDQANFIEGIKTEIRYHIYRITNLQAHSDNSVFTNNDFLKSDKEITREINANYLILGEVCRAGNIIRTSIKIIEGKTGKILWFQPYYDTIVDPSQIIAVQIKIALQIANELQAQLNKDLTKRMNAITGNNIENYDLHLKGKQEYSKVWKKFGAKQVHVGCVNLIEAIVPDNIYLDACISLYDSHSLLTSWDNDIRNGYCNRLMKSRNKAIKPDYNNFTKKLKNQIGFIFNP